MLALQAWSAIFAMQPNKRTAADMSGQDTASKREQKHPKLEDVSQSAETQATPAAVDQETVLIWLEKKGKTISLSRQAVNVAQYFGNTTQPKLMTKEELEKGIQFKDFYGNIVDDNIVELTCDMLKVIFNLDQSREFFINLENRKNKILKIELDHRLENQAQYANFDIIKAWYFADFLGVPKLEDLFIQLIVETICTPEFLATYRGNEFYSDHPRNKEFREQLHQALNAYIKIYFPKLLKYTLLKTLGAQDNVDNTWISCLCVTPDGKIVSGSYDGTIKIWACNPATHEYTLFKTLNTANKITCLCIAQDGKIVSGSYEGTINIWNYPEYTLSRIINAHNKYITCVCITPDGKIVSKETCAPTIKIWTYDSENQQYTSQTPCIQDDGHTGEVIHLCAKLDGKIVSVSSDGTIRIWTCDTKKQRYTPQTLVAQAGGSIIRNACVTPDGKIVSASWDKTIKIWVPSTLTIEEIITNLKQELAPQSWLGWAAGKLWQFAKK